MTVTPEMIKNSMKASVRAQEIAVNCFCSELKDAINSEKLTRAQIEDLIDKINTQFLRFSTNEISVRVLDIAFPTQSLEELTKNKETKNDTNND